MSKVISQKWRKLQDTASVTVNDYMNRNPDPVQKLFS